MNEHQLSANRDNPTTTGGSRTDIRQGHRRAAGGRPVQRLHFRGRQKSGTQQLVTEVAAGKLVMKFYDCATAPSPRRVRVFLA